ncbi:hypothetical protein MACH09_45260 [Vibrio sp. MACH09]|uniref:hypothetical protein n=1 Tax=Vibrio sp. MACH09 TaxID=3025122 RepID=UPI00278F428E|nr:hypothetical protein [Vibrio sp. MACH09]GLO64018.1 hypothetical protein MACH09_45260 [Vibrio sp. MACH09]
MTQELLPYSKLVNKLRIANFEEEGFRSEVSFAPEGFAETIDWNWQLENLKPINLFIGPNNSGKSRLLRFLLVSDLSEMEFDDYLSHTIVDSLFHHEFSPNLSQDLVSGGFNKGISTSIRTELYRNHVSGLSYKNLEVIIRNIALKVVQNSRPILNSEHDQRFAKEILENASDPALFSQLVRYSDTTFKKVYIPLLRGLRTLADEDVYLNRTLQDYFNNKGLKPNNGANKLDEDGKVDDKLDVLSIFTGHTLYEDLKKHCLEITKSAKVLKTTKISFHNTFLMPKKLLWYQES